MSDHSVSQAPSVNHKNTVNDPRTLLLVLKPLSLRFFSNQLRQKRVNPLKSCHKTTCTVLLAEISSK